MKKIQLGFKVLVFFLILTTFDQKLHARPRRPIDRLQGVFVACSSSRLSRSNIGGGGAWV